MNIRKFDPQIGEIDKCPNCKKKLREIPSKKKKCEFCGNYIYVNTRPFDRKRVLLTEKQKAEVQTQWSLCYHPESGHYSNEDSEYTQIKKELIQETGKEPSENDIKWSLFNKRAKEYSSTKQWGLYRNNRLDTAFLLLDELRFYEALQTHLEVCYLDLNGCWNIGPDITKEDIKHGIKEFNTNLAHVLPFILDEIIFLSSSLGISQKDVKKIFFDINKKRKPIKEMPVSIEKAWESIENAWKQSIKKDKLNEEIDKLNPKDLGNTLKNIKVFIHKKDYSSVSRIVELLKSDYCSSKTPIPNPQKIKLLLKILLHTNEQDLKKIGESLLLSLIGKDIKAFQDIAKKHILYIKKNFEKYVESNTIGMFSEISPYLVKPLIPQLINTLKKHPEWNARRFAAFNIGAIGTKKPDFVKKAIPILIDYIRNPKEVTKRKPLEIKIKGVSIKMELSAEKMLGVDQTQWLKNAYIDSLGMIARGDKTLIIKYKPLLENIAQKDINEYSRKKAQEVLDLL